MNIELLYITYDVDTIYIKIVEWHDNYLKSMS